MILLLRQLNISNVKLPALWAGLAGAPPVMPDLIRHPGQFWIPASAGMTVLPYIVAGVIMRDKAPIYHPISKGTDLPE